MQKICGKLFLWYPKIYFSDIKENNAGVPQRSMLDPVLYLLYIYDTPQLENNTITTFAGDTDIMTVEKTDVEANKKVQEAVDKIHNWTKN